jgi:2-polyprenyl-3-methyl-5-hydroxy-6-metoxy-1,4-benzoquinol methylase
MKMKTWKARLYDSYVSSGHATRGSTKEFHTAEAAFKEHAAQIVRFIRQYIPPNRESKIVDLGCGHGLFVYFLSKLGYSNVSGVDGSEAQVMLAHDLGLRHIVHNNILSYLQRSASESIDVVLLIDVLEHLEYPELFAVLDDVHRVLSPSGSCIVHVPNGEGLFGMRVKYSDLTHETAFTRKSAEQLFKVVGFSRISCHEDRPTVHGPTSLMRRMIWDVGTVPYRILFAAETGRTDVILSQNMSIRATK